AMTWKYQDQFTYAQNARTRLAQQYYNLLIQVTGAQDPNTNAAILNGTPSFQAARYLAQLAVNIVDYLDNDDYSTPLRWYTNPTDNTIVEFVFGTEPPRVVLNETFCQLDNIATDLDGVTPDNSRATGYRLNVWVELHNPFKDSSSEAYPLDGGKVRLNV